MIDKKERNKHIKLYDILIFGLALAINKHGLKMPVLANALFGPQFSFSQHFEQCSCSMTHSS